MNLICIRNNKQKNDDKNLIIDKINKETIKFILWDYFELYG